MKLQGLFAIVFIFFSTQLHAEGIKNSAGRMEIDWGKMTVKFYGETEPTAQPPKDFNNGEQNARVEGHKYLQTARADLHQAASVEMSDEIANKSSLPAEIQPRSTNTTFFSSGKVRVDLEVPLASSLQPKALRFLNNKPLKSDTYTDASDTKNNITATGVVIELSDNIKPRAVFSIIGDDGSVLYSTENVRYEAFKRNLMGRWFSRPNASDLYSAAGSKPLKIKAKVMAPDQYQVDTETWQTTVGQVPEVLADARVALVVP